VVALGVLLLALCVIGFFIKSKTIQHFRPLILFASLVYFGFILKDCTCILFYFQGFVLFLMGKSAFWLSFVVMISIIVLSVVFGAIWCGWLCWLGALQEFIYQKNKWNLLKTKNAQQILIYIQTAAFVALTVWIVIAFRPVMCGYDPFVSIFKLKIFNWVGYITVPLLLFSSLIIYRPFCRILCPIGWMLYMVKYLPFAKKLKIAQCTDCRKCHPHCKLNAIQNHEALKTCNLCGECKNGNCNSLTI
jgi:polyferredoxin